MTDLGPRTKGLRLTGPVSAAAVAARRESLSADTFSWPLLTLDDDALTHNITGMAQLCRDYGVEHAPHVKTSMSPELFARQLAAGAWGATVATPGQLRTVRSWVTSGDVLGGSTAGGALDGPGATGSGAPEPGEEPGASEQRVFLANELLDLREIRWLRAEIEASLLPGAVPLTVWLYVDSDLGVQDLAQVFSSARPEVLARLGVLVELGQVGGRTGARSPAEVLRLAQVAQAAGLNVLGVAGYEGSAASGTGPDDLAKVEAFLQSMREAAALLDQAGLIPGAQPVVLSAGGSSFLDVVLTTLPGDLPTTDGRAPRPTTVVVRSGAYLTHDHGFCARMDPWSRVPQDVQMQAAATVWGQVLSVPEPGLVIIGIGKRDVSYDIDLPVPLVVRPRSEAGPEGAAAVGSGGPRAAVSGATVTGLNDQHLFLSVAPDGTQIRPGDVVGFGISHPCTLFDKWRAAAVVDPHGIVTEVITTDF